MLALKAARSSQFQAAMADVAAAQNPPANLGVDSFAKITSSRLLMYKALLFAAEGDSSAAAAAWHAAAQTTNDAIEGDGLFRAIALYKVGQVQKADDWFKQFVVINDQRKTDNSLTLRLHAYEMAGIYAVMQGNRAVAAENFQKALQIDQSYLYARQSLAWLKAGMFAGLRN
jgi:tetratricopeptide (TPR) repeat protein